MRRSHDAGIDQGDKSLIPVMNLVCLLIPFLLYTASFVAFAAVPATAPRITPGPPRDQVETPERPNLALVITDQGFHVRAPEGAAPASCGRAEEGRAVLPLRASAASCVDGAGYPTPRDRAERQALRLGPPTCAYDFEGLEACIGELHAEDPAADRIVILGERNVGYDVLIRAMDVARGPESAPRFPDVVLGSGVS